MFVYHIIWHRLRPNTRRSLLLRPVASRLALYVEGAQWVLCKARKGRFKGKNKLLNEPKVLKFAELSGLRSNLELSGRQYSDVAVVPATG